MRAFGRAHSASPRPLFVAAVVSIVLATVGVGVSEKAFAIEKAPDWAYAMAHELMSPYCPGRTLAECPSPQATELRFWILTQAAAGVSEEDVREMLAERFGDILLAAPRAEGWGLSAYVVPIGFFVLGGPVVFLIIRRLASSKGVENYVSPRAMGPNSAAAAGSADPVDLELEKQLERELAEF